MSIEPRYLEGLESCILVNRKTRRPLPIRTDAFTEPTHAGDVDSSSDERANRFVNYCASIGVVLDERITPQDGSALGAMVDAWRSAEKALAEETKGAAA